MSFFKKAQAKIQSVAAQHGLPAGSFGSSSGSVGGGGPPQVPIGSKPQAEKPDIMTLRDRFIIRNPTTGQLEVEGTGEVVRFASLCAPEVGILIL